MTPAAFDKLLDEFSGEREHDAALIRENPVSDTRELQALLDQCDDEAEAQLIVTVNAAIAEQLAAPTIAYLQFLDAGKSERPEVERLLAQVRAAPDPASAEALLTSADPDTYAHGRFTTRALDRMSAEDVQKTYFAMLEVGK